MGGLYIVYMNFLIIIWYNHMEFDVYMLQPHILLNSQYIAPYTTVTKGEKGVVKPTSTLTSHQPPKSLST